MARMAWIAQLRQGMAERYIKSHNPIWPELEEAIKGAGVRNYSIFLDDETMLLFGYFEVDEEGDVSRIDEELNRRWADKMRPMFVLADDGEQLTRYPREVFHLE